MSNHIISYIVFLVADEVSIAICLQALPTEAETKNRDGNIKVNASKIFADVNRSDERNLHIFASRSNFLPFKLAQQTLDALPRASFRTQIVAAARPTRSLFNPSPKKRACVLKILLVADTNL